MCGWKCPTQGVKSSMEERCKVVKPFIANCANYKKDKINSEEFIYCVVGVAFFRACSLTRTCTRSTAKRFCCWIAITWLVPMYLRIGCLNFISVQRAFLAFEDSSYTSDTIMVVVKDRIPGTIVVIRRVLLLFASEHQ